jgi:hypothetical protein
LRCHLFDPLQETPVVIDDVVERNEFQELANREEHKVHCHQRLTLDVLDHNHWVNEGCHDVTNNHTEYLTRIIVSNQILDRLGTYQVVWSIILSTFLDAVADSREN